MPNKIAATVRVTSSSIIVKPYDGDFMARHTREASLLEPDVPAAAPENET